MSDHYEGELLAFFHAIQSLFGLTGNDCAADAQRVAEEVARLTRERDEARDEREALREFVRRAHGWMVHADLTALVSDSEAILADTAAAGRAWRVEREAVWLVRFADEMQRLGGEAEAEGDPWTLTACQFAERMARRMLEGWRRAEEVRRG